MGKKLWGGRFSKKTDPLVEEFTKSIQYDYKLALYDVLGSIKHVRILHKAGYLTLSESNRLKAALQKIYHLIQKGGLKPDNASEDIHTQIQNMVQRKVGGLSQKLQTARSRNDQVAYATKMYSLEKISQVKGDIQSCK